MFVRQLARAVVFASLAATAAAQTPISIRAGTLIDGKGGTHRVQT